MKIKQALRWGVKLIDSVHWLVSLLFLSGLRVLSPSASAPGSVQTIVVVRNCFFGDFVVAIPALRRLRRAFPRARILFLTATSFAPGWRDRPQEDGVFSIEPGLIDEVVSYTSQDLRTAKARAALRERVASSGPLLTIALCYSADSLRSRLKRILLCRVLSLPFPLGLTGVPTLPALPWLHHWRVGRTDMVHQRDAALACAELALRQAGVSLPTAEPPPTRSIPTPKDGSLTIGVAPFTKQPVKQWPLDRFAEVMRTLSAQRNVRFEIYGAAEESEQARQLEVLLGNDVSRASLCGQLSPRQLRQHIESIDLLLCLDSGPAHIASLVGTPTLAIFSQITLHDFWRPWGQGGHLISHDVPCAACGTYTGQCPIGTKACIDGVQTIEVLRRVRTMLNIEDCA